MSEEKERALARRMIRQQSLESERSPSKSRKVKKPFILEEFIPVPDHPDPRPESLDQLNIRIGYYDHWMLWGHYRSLQDAMKAKDALMMKGMILVYPKYRMRIRVGTEIVWESCSILPDSESIEHDAMS